MGFFEFIISFQSLEKHVHHRYPAPPRAFKTQLCYLLHIILTSVKASSSAILHTKFLHWVSCTEAKKEMDLILFPVFLRLDLHVQALGKSLSWQHKAIFLNTCIKTEQLLCMAKHFTAD